MQDRIDQRQHRPMRLSRRDALKLAGGFGVAAAAAALPRAAFAQAAPAVPNGGGFYRFKLGSFTVTLLSDGQATGPLFPGFAGNPGRQDVYSQYLRELRRRTFVNNFIPAVVDTGRNKVLLDTGVGPAGVQADSAARALRCGYGRRTSTDLHHARASRPHRRLTADG
jgi:hypothetical protein